MVSCSAAMPRPIKRTSSGMRSGNACEKTTTRNAEPVCRGMGSWSKFQVAANATANKEDAHQIKSVQAALVPYVRKPKMKTRPEALFKRKKKAIPLKKARMEGGETVTARAAN